MTIQEHLEQARHNEAVALQLGSPTVAAYDWAITVLFYAVLHLVDAHLLQRHRVVSRGHIATWERQTRQRLPGRNDHVRQYLPQIAFAYMRLYAASRRARYEGAFLGSEGRAYYEKVRDNEFTTIKNLLLPHG